MKNPYKNTNKYYNGIVKIIDAIEKMREKTNFNICLRIYIDKNMLLLNKHDKLTKNELLNKWFPSFK